MIPITKKLSRFRRNLHLTNFFVLHETQFCTLPLKSRNFVPKCLIMNQESFHIKINLQISSHASHEMVVYTVKEIHVQHLTFEPFYTHFCTEFNINTLYIFALNQKKHNVSKNTIFRALEAFYKMRKKGTHDILQHVNFVLTPENTTVSNFSTYVYHGSKETTNERLPRQTRNFTNY